MRAWKAILSFHGNRNIFYREKMLKEVVDGMRSSVTRKYFTYTLYGRNKYTETSSSTLKIFFNIV